VHAAANEPEVKRPGEQNLISGNVPGPITPVNTATSVDELTKKS
jgi:hypothetical protein